MGIRLARRPWPEDGLLDVLHATEGQFLCPMTLDQVSWLDLAQHRLLEGALIDRVATAWMQLATSRWIGRVGHFPFKDDALDPGSRVGPEHR